MFVNTLKRGLSSRDERGFSLIVAIVVLSVATLLLFGAVDAVFYNTGPTRADLDQKRALLAADAGLSVYDSALNSNPNFWESCPVSGAAGATGTTGTPVTVPGSTNDGSIETYTYENLPATGQTGCNASNPIATTIEKSNTPANGTFRVKFTGTSQPTTGTARAPISRTLVAQFNAANFLQYVYFTNFEILDPAATGDSVTACSVYYWTSPAPATGQNRNSNCGGAINFITGDVINGPMHSNDDVSISGSPQFGSTSSDAVEAPGFYSNNGTPTTTCTSCDIVGMLNTAAPTLQLPPNDLQLLQVADGDVATQTNGCYTKAGCVFTGPTTIVLTGSTFTVTNASYNSGAATTGLSPSNGVIYIANASGGCTPTNTYTPYIVNSTATYSNADNTGCGNATVSGTYSNSLTIGTDNDIIINGNITPTGVTVNSSSGGTPPTPSGTALLGLIANDFVRVYHPLSGTRSSASFGTCPNPNTNATGSLTNLYVYAAILAVNHSFIVDNFDCGTTLGDLYVYGVIAQNFRGPVGTESGGTVVSGYTKGYYYDTRFQALSPPYFLDPVSAGWEVNRVTECDSSTGC
jgi:Tfp pilus assembly protein PilX